jgi:hypothetical protein
MKMWLNAFLIWIRQMPLTSKPMPSWEDSDAAALRNFFISATGRRYLERMDAMRCEITNNAVFQRKNAGCEYALGFAAAVAWSKSLSGNVNPHTDEHEGETKDAISRFEEWASN